jgi:hypothetical protein
MMADLSHLSDDDLSRIANGPDLSHLSDSDLQKIANPSMGQSIMGAVGTGLKALNSVTLAPVEAGIYAAQNGQNPFSAATKQFGNMNQQAPSGKDIAEKAGLSIKSFAPRMSSLGDGGFGPASDRMAMQKMGADTSPAGLAGGAIDQVANPLNYIGPVLSKAGEGLSALTGSLVPKEGAEAIAEASKRLGFKATPGMLSDSPIVGKLEDSLRQGPNIPGILVRNKIDPINEGLQKAAESLIGDSNTINPSSYAAGNDAASGILANVGEQISNVKDAYEPFNAELPKMVPDELSKYKLADQVAKIGDSHIDPNETEGLVTGITNRIMGSKNLGDIEDTRKILGNKISQAYSDNDRAMVDTLTKVKDALSDYRDDQFQTLAQQSYPGQQGAAMGKQMVSQYKDAMAQHASLMNNLQDVAPIFGIKASNPRDFVEAFNDIPAEQLATQLFKTNDFRAMQKVQTFFPEEFEKIRQLKLNELRRASLDSTVNPDISPVNPYKLVMNINKIKSPEVRTLLLGDKAGTFSDMQTVLGSRPSVLGPSGTPEGLQYSKDFLHSQLTSIPKYGLYRALGSPSVSKVLTEVPNAMSSIPAAAGPAASATVLPFTPQSMPGIQSMLPRAADANSQKSPNVGGPISNMGPQGYSDGGTVQQPDPPPTHIDVAQAQAAQDSLRKAFHFAAGGVVPGVPNLPVDSPRNDNTLIKATPGEVVLPLSVTQSSNAPQKAKEFMANQMTSKNTQSTGQDKWAMDGFHNLRSHVNDDDRATLDKYKSAMLLDPKMKNLLVTASDYEPGSKPLDQILGHLKTKLGEGDK